MLGGQEIDPRLGVGVKFVGPRLGKVNVAIQLICQAYCTLEFSVYPFKMDEWLLEPGLSEDWPRGVSQLSFELEKVLFREPSEGRMLYARFNINGTLIVRASDIFDFKKKNQEGFDLFIRYYNCEPEDTARPVENSPSPTIIIGRTSQVQNC
ncbi:hypothetical protein N7516_003147 [Penicillium verrucosum]|uniref:uncharacterized protein n=1 Tax=Penicillium verrucosum TaxID=60171 RepID=UPI00254557E1|nr:uncharacterized protein N7516_003147 [Penicillium verrucosum]KAJ5942979.1 hypothetical protein N7516_003147 [Penicillium verrucosum]